MVKFESGIEWFQKMKFSPRKYFKRGISFIGGKSIPFIRGEIKDEKSIKGITDYMYAVKHDKD